MEASGILTELYSGEKWRGQFRSLSQQSLLAAITGPAILGPQQQS